MNVDPTTVIVDKQTGQRIPYADYQQRLKPDPYAFHLEPVYNEYGKPGSYTLRPTTPEEHDAHRFYDPDTSQRPKVGDDMPLFVMTGSDGKTYRPTDLKGNVVLLSFWLTLQRPLFDQNRVDKLADLLKPYQTRADFTALGTLSSSAAEVSDYMTSHSLPFVPVPDAFSFSKKFQVLSVPSYIVVDKTGKVAAYLEGDDQETLKNVLERVSR